MKKIQSALISVYYKEGLENIILQLDRLGITIYSTGGTQQFIESLHVRCVPVESLTGYPSILGGRVKTLHPSVFGAILGRRENETDVNEMKEYNIPEIDLVIIDLYPFEETVRSLNNGSFDGEDIQKETLIIEKIDIGGPSMIRAAAKNHQDVVIVASKSDYSLLSELLDSQEGHTTLMQRRTFAIKAFDVCTAYDTAISNYFHQSEFQTPFNREEKSLRYGENPHQQASFFGNLDDIFSQVHGKELSYNNLVDVEAAIQLIREFETPQLNNEFVFAIIKHTNVCGIAARLSLAEAWKDSLAGDPESAFGGVLVCNSPLDVETSVAINELFFEVLIAPSFTEDALQVLRSKKNRILLQLSQTPLGRQQSKYLLNGLLVQDNDDGNFVQWREVGDRETTDREKQDLIFANIVCKHLKSNAIAIVNNKQLLGKGCGQTSRIDALNNSLEKANRFGFDLSDAVLASDAFFPFDDCVKIAHKAGVNAFIQPGGSIRDADSIDYCKQNNLAMVITAMRHFKH